MKIDVAVIGGGAAGLMASSAAGARGLRTVLFEPNDYTGKKLGITGKGRCNVCNACPVEDVMKNVPTNARFLFSALYSFTPRDVMDTFEALGVPLKIERGNRVFPVSDRARDIVEALRRSCKANGVFVKQERVLEILTDEDKVTAVKTNKGLYPCRAAILCTGGASYPLTGSTGDGYRLSAKLGHTVKEIRPSLVPLEIVQGCCKDLQGLSLKNVTLTAVDEKGKVLYKELGEMLFTHYGMSGPLVLSASAHMRDYEKHSYKVIIDLKPGLDEKKLDARILRDFEKYHTKILANGLEELLHKRMIDAVLRMAGLNGDTRISEVTKAQRQALLETVKGLTFDVAGPRPISEAIITSGGIDVKQVNPKTMESKLVHGLYFAGEVLDVDAYTGGFNLQIAWSTAHAAGQSVLSEE